MINSESASEAIISRLDQILNRLDQLESRLEKSEKALQEIPGVAATALNTLDELSAPLRMEGSEWPERLPSLLNLAEKLTQPNVLEALEVVAAHADQFVPLIKMLADVPGLISASVNGLDENADHLKNSGVDLQERGQALLQVVLQATDPRTLHLISELLHQRDTLLLGVHAMRDIPGIMSMAVDSLDEFYKQYDLGGHDFGSLLHSLRHGILDIHTVALVASAGEALASSEQDYKPASLFTMFKALGEPEFRNSMGFLLSFMRHFSRSLQAERIKKKKN